LQADPGRFFDIYPTGHQALNMIPKSAASLSPCLVSMVVPVYNEVDILPELTRRLAGVVNNSPDTVQWEVLYINDGSHDGSGEAIQQLVLTYPWLKAVHLSRNFGHQIAISAGIDFALGDVVVLMDGDLQDPPELVPDMLALWQQGYDVVYATRRHREGENWFKTTTAALYYRFLRYLSGIDIPLDTGDFRLMGRNVVDAIKQMPEKSRFIRGMVSWTGFRQTPIYYDRDARYSGETKYTLIKMTRVAMDGVMSFSRLPLQWIMSAGFIISTVSFLLAVLVLCLRFFTAVPVQAGWSSLMIAILMLGGIQLICLGMLGEYIGRIFDEVRGRPLYLVSGLAMHPDARTGKPENAKMQGTPLIR
jgi:polyisoprenyl-phosphate glycosyltransferase